VTVAAVSRRERAPRTRARARANPDSASVAAVCRARRIVRELGGRFSIELGIEVDRDPAEVERWALAATLFGNRIPAEIAMRTYRVLERAGVRTIEDAGGRARTELIALLDEGGYVRYDERTPTRLLALADVIANRLGGSLGALGEHIEQPADLEHALGDLPGWGPVTVHVFLRELRGLWPGAALGLDDRTILAARHLEFPTELEGLRALAWAAHLDVRDLEAALVRLSLCHRFEGCPGGEECPLAGFEPGQPKQV
jgi:hypothetical protein